MTQTKRDFQAGWVVVEHLTRIGSDPSEYQPSQTVYSKSQDQYLLLRELPQKVNPRSLAFIGEVIFFDREIVFFGICFVVFMYAALW
jgi:hypothetical protein